MVIQEAICEVVMVIQEAISQSEAGMVQTSLTSSPISD
jgi:hypothetical protein